MARVASAARLRATRSLRRGSLCRGPRPRPAPSPEPNPGTRRRVDALVSCFWPFAIAAAARRSWMQPVVAGAHEDAVDGEIHHRLPALNPGAGGRRAGSRRASARSPHPRTTGTTPRIGTTSWGLVAQERSAATGCVELHLAIEMPPALAVRRIPVTARLVQEVALRRLGIPVDGVGVLVGGDDAHPHAALDRHEPAPVIRPSIESDSIAKPPDVR